MIEGVDTVAGSESGAELSVAVVVCDTDRAGEADDAGGGGGGCGPGCGPGGGTGNGGRFQSRR